VYDSRRAVDTTVRSGAAQVMATQVVTAAVPVLRLVKTGWLGLNGGG